MDGLEEKLGALLSDPAALGQIQKLAETLSGSGGFSGFSAPEEPGSGGGSGPLPEGRLTELLGKLMSAYAAPSEASRLVSALKPLLRRERAERLEKALRISRLVQAARLALPELMPLTGPASGQRTER